MLVWGCERTIARIRRYADKEHNEQDQKIRRQMNLCMFVDCSVCIRICMCVFLCLSVRKHMQYINITEQRTIFLFVR